MFRRDSLIRWTLLFLAAAWLPISDAVAADLAPSLPGAVSKAPDWLGSGVPFDVKAYFVAPPPEQNAAPLYLDALFEFTSDVENCFPEGEERTRRKAAADDRMKRWKEINESFQKDPKSVPADQIDALLADYGPGWRKIVAAQKRSKCVFQTGIGIGSPLTHAQASRQVVRVAELRTRQALERNDLESPIADLQAVLRLSRDLRPRGYPITQLVSAAMDLVSYLNLVTPILDDPRFTTRTSTKLMNTLLEHDRLAIEPFSEGVKGDYLLTRNSMRDAVRRGPELVRELGGAPGDSLFGTIIRLMKNQTPTEEMESPLAPANHPTYLEMDARVAKMTPAAVRKDVDRVNAYFRALLALTPKRPAERKQGLPDPRQMDTKDDLSKLVIMTCQNYEALIPALGRDVAHLRGTECLVALRRWQVVEKTPPTDLLAICKAAGLPAVPIDPHSGKAMKMAVVDGSPVIYSIGIDDKDDGGLVDSKNETVPGDILFRLGPSRP